MKNFDNLINEYKSIILESNPDATTKLSVKDIKKQLKSAGFKANTYKYPDESEAPCFSKRVANWFILIIVIDYENEDEASTDFRFAYYLKYAPDKGVNDINHYKNVTIASDESDMQTGKRRYNNLTDLFEKVASNCDDFIEEYTNLKSAMNSMKF